MSDSLGGILVLLRLWLSSMSAGQILSLLLGVGALVLALKVVRKGLSIILKILAVILILYFFAPGLLGSLLLWLPAAPSGI